MHTPRFINKSDFIKNILILFSGSSIAQVVPVLISPLLSRIYTPEDFGIQSLFISTYTILAIAAGMRYDMAIMLPADNKDARSLFIITILFTLLFSTLAGLIILLFYNYIILIFNLPESSYWLFLIPFAVFSKSYIQSSFLYFNRLKRFKVSAKGKIYQSLVSSAAMLSFGVTFLPGSSGLIWGKLSGLFQNTFYFFIKKEKRKSTLDFKNFPGLIRRYKKFPFYSVPNGFLNAISVQLPVFVLTAYYDPVIAGFYAFAYRLVIIPINLISGSIKDVYYQRVSEFFNSGKDMLRIVRKSYSQMILTFGIPFILFFLTAPSVFRIIFGEEWFVSGEYIQIVLPWLFLVFINTPMSTIPAILNKQQLMLYYNIALVIARFLTLYAGFVIYNDPYMSLLFYSISGVCFNLVFIIMIFFITKQTQNEIVSKTQ